MGSMVSPQQTQLRGGFMSCLHIQLVKVIQAFNLQRRRKFFTGGSATQQACRVLYMYM
ncbi:hypothetical protein F441_12561 [Phytophthora nicotianae CJ01A1]|uniref:Uncharacterized protein n=6 Tax=Phytophthora nicotianae TaxID=4792 RepID=V9ESH8_PHYNI|nr:hypothetical protein F443_12596 [Phytophthora nicotianae P1569]ETO70878.1 hypothetical protein F444_12697 [Phytophthora nicotianae P1976]ETP11980.1 hypothetical protein F441_12561 [Phytophthora nicotianae CJ01A1]ETP40094.1 hypothetical protein F442_12513 [Phytophthora nicotianae P10297]